MSLFGFDAFGRYAFAQLPRSPYVTMAVLPGAYVVAGVSVTFSDVEVATGSSYALSGVAAGFGDALAAAGGAYALTGRGAVFAPMEAAVSASYALTGVATTVGIAEPAASGAYGVAGAAVPIGASVNAASGSFALAGVSATFPMVWNVAGTAYAWTLTPLNQYTLTRTGDDYEFKLGGVGHFLEELEARRQLAAITRKTPAPIDRTTAPAFAPISTAQPAPPASAPPAPHPAAVRAALLQTHLAEAATRAAIATRRRREAELLLLVA